MTTKRRLLFLAYYFPPVSAVACVRTLNIAKYLTRKGWEVGIVTPAPDLWGRVSSTNGSHPDSTSLVFFYTAHALPGLNSTFLRAGRRGLGYLLWGVCRLTTRHLHVESEVGWGYSVRKMLPAFRAWRPDVILASGGPFVSHRMAAWLAERLSCPFVVDYRDGWSLNPYAPRGQGKRNLRSEASVLLRSGAVTCVTWTLGQATADLFGCGDKLHVITNGYDPEEMAGVSPQPYRTPTIVYAGTFAPPYRIAAPIMATLQRLRSASGIQGWRFHYYGSCAAHVRETAAAFGMQDEVTIHGEVPRREALSAMAGATVTVVIASVRHTESPSERGVLTGKLFDAIGVGARVLGIAPEKGDLWRVLQETPEAKCFRVQDVAGMARWLESIRTRQPARIVPSERYAWPTLANQFDAILERVIEDNGVIDPGADGDHSQRE